MTPQRFRPVCAWIYVNDKTFGVARPISLLKQAFFRCLTEYVHLQERSNGKNQVPTSILTRGEDNFCKYFIASFLGLFLKEKNLLPEEQILFF